MLQGLFIYKREDEQKLKPYMDEFGKYSQKYDLNFNFLSDYNIVCGFIEGKFRAKSSRLDITDIDFVINLSRNTNLAKCLEMMGIRVFNNSNVSALCNNKANMHFAVNSLGIKSEDTYFVQKTGASLTNFATICPVVVKSAVGYGGNDVNFANDQKELAEIVAMNVEHDYLVQKYVQNYNASDVKVYVVGGKIIGAIKSMVKGNFKTSNSPDRECYSYTMNSKEIALVSKILKIENFDFVSIDFIVGYGEEWYFNEIEHIVTGEDLFNTFNINFAEKVCEYVAKNVKKKK